MTNKLPVVGKIYKGLISDLVYESLFIKGDQILLQCENENSIMDFYSISDFWEYFEELPEDKAETSPMDIVKNALKEGVEQMKQFNERMDREYPNCRSTEIKTACGHSTDLKCNFCEIKPETQSHISELSAEVKEAMEELRKNIKQIGDNITGSFIPLANINFNEDKELMYKTLYQTQNLLNALDKEFSLNGHFEGLPPSREAIERSKAQPDENGSFKHIGGTEELSQELMKKNIEPNKETLKSFSNYEKGVGLTEHNSVEELFDDLEEESIRKPVVKEEIKIEFHPIPDCKKHGKRLINDAVGCECCVKEKEVKEKFILDSIYYDKQGLPVSVYKKETEIDRENGKKLREYLKEKYKNCETQPDENDSFKHMDGAEELSQELMKKDIFGSGKKQVESEKKIEEEAYQALSIQNRTSIWKPVNEEVENQSIIFINKAGYARLAEAWNDKFYFIEGDAGGTDVKSHMIDKTYYVKKFCTLTDYINNIEERLRKLEGK